MILNIMNRALIVSKMFRIEFHNPVFIWFYYEVLDGFSLKCIRIRSNDTNHIEDQGKTNIDEVYHRFNSIQLRSTSFYTDLNKRTPPFHKDNCTIYPIEEI